MPDMKVVSIETDADTLRKLRTALVIRNLSGQTWGYPEAFVAKIVQALDAGQGSVRLVSNKKGE